MRLRVAQHLQAVFELAQEAVGVDQRGAVAAGRCPRLAQRMQRGQQAALAQRRFASAADQLQRLREEFDFADAAGPALDVVGEFLARDFGGDRRLHLAQAVERAVVEIAAVHERPQRLQECSPACRSPATGRAFSQA